MENVNKFTAWGAAILIPVSLLLGFVGYRHLASGTISVSDAAFGSIQLFALESPTDVTGSPALDIARFTAPFSLALATVAALMAVLSQQMRRIALRWRGRGHVVLIGVDGPASELACALIADGRRVVALEMNPNPAFLEVEAAGATTFVGDVRQPSLLRRARVDRADQALVAMGADMRTLEVCDALTSFLGSRSTSIHASIQDVPLWAQLSRTEVGQRSSGPSIEFYNPADRQGGAFVDLLFAHLGALPREIAFEGDGELAKRVLVRVARGLALEDAKLKLIVSQNTHASVVASLASAEPWISSVLDVQVVADPIAATAVICGERSDARPLTTALRLAQNLQVDYVFVCSSGRGGREVLDLKRLSPKVHMLPADSAWLNPDTFFQQSWVELMARARHEDYCANERTRGVTIKQNRSVVPWRSLPESLRESNRAFARAVGDVLARLGASLIPLQGPPSSMSIAPEQAEQLARAEHDRWSQALVSDGWSYAPPPKDPVGRTHPLLVDWDELDEAEREKDRDAIRAIPKMLARVGYSLEIPEGSDKD